MLLLVFAGDIMVRGSVSAARRLNVSTLVIGLTVIAFGTSAPELMVAINAMIAGVPDLVLGNVVGSNIANIWLVLGVPAIIAPMVCRAPRFTHNMVIMLAASGLIVIMGFTGGLNFWKGLFLLSLLALFLLYSARSGKQDPMIASALEEFDAESPPTNSLLLASLMIIGGLGGLVLGADLLVDGSVVIARVLGVSEAVIGLTIVAIGTSLPELVTGIVSALRNQCDVAVGNVIGSNIFNLLGILGASALIGPLPASEEFLEFDFWIMLLASLSLLPFAYLKMRIGRRSGLVFLIAYILYIFLLASGFSGVEAVDETLV